GAELSDLAIEALEREARPGISEHALAAIVEGAYLGLGGQTHIHYMGSTPMRNPSLCVPSQQQSNRVLERGDVLITEISAQYHGYPGQILRPFAISEPPTPAYQRLYDVAVEAYERVAAVIHAGATAEAVLDAAECIHAAGYSICDDLVHGFGGGYLPPVIRTRQTGGTSTPTFTFEENMTVVIQPNVITLDEHMGLQVGELVRVTHAGVASLHRYPMKFILCG
ncbi:MAG: M24 family metallopeptidase, partial [Ktedonobacterales bacterium]